MRELKFRAYCEVEKRYFYFDLDTWVAKTAERLRVQNSKRELFTGVKDIEKKEIYEGDIIDIDLSFIEEIFRAVVVFQDGAFGYNTQIGFKTIHKYCKVIGNRHKNSELMKE